MAEELKIKVRVDSSDVSRGTDEAKNKVKQAADSMKSNAANAASSMKASMDSVAKSTASIGDAAKSAENSVREMDRGVARSAANMEKNLASVRRQMSAMQLFHMGARGATMIGGAAANIARLNGNYDAAEGIDSAIGILVGGMQGAAMGTYFGPWGIAIGALVGAGTGLIDAAVKQKEAASKQLEAANAQIAQSKNTIQATDDAVRARKLNQKATEFSELPTGVFDEENAQHMIDTAKAKLKASEAKQARYLDMLYGRNNVSLMADWGDLLLGTPGQTKLYAGNGVTIDLADIFPTDFGTYNWMDTGHQLAIESRIKHALIDNIADWIYHGHKDKYVIEELFSKEGWQRFLKVEWEGLKYILPFIDSEWTDPDHMPSVDALTRGLSKKLYEGFESHLADITREVEAAQNQLNALSPLQSRLDKERAASEARMNAPLNFEDWGPFDQEGPTDSGWFDIASEAAKRREAAELELASGTDLMKTLQSRLAGIYSLAASPTDALTKIGGGVGYTSYNNSVLTVTKSIEKSLNTLIQNQLRQNEEIKQEIENLKFIEGTTWQ